MKQKIVIIGAGPAGLTAAYELLQQPKEYEVTVLEASPFIGGISRTAKHGDNRIDIGGHRFFSKDERVMQWWREILPYQGALSKDDKLLHREARLVAGGPDPETEDEVFLIRHRVSRIYYGGAFFDYPVTLKPETFINMGLVQSVKAGCSYLASCVHKLPETSLENFYVNRFGRVLYSMFFEGYTEKLWGRHPREISADWGAQRVKGLSIAALITNVLQKLLPTKNKHVETSLIEEFYYPKYGPGQLWETVAKRIEEKGGTILFGKEVVSFTQEDNRITSVVCADGAILDADAVISSMPLNQLANALPYVPANAKEVADGLPYRDFVTVGLLVDKLAIKNKTNIKTLGNIVPDCWIYVQDTSVKLGRVQVFNNWSPYLLKDPEHTVWIGLEYFCKEGDNFWNKSEEDTVKLAIKELIKIGIIDGKSTVLESCREKVTKAYPAYFDTYDRIGELTSYLNTVENLYCVGRNGQHRYNNMDHSMATAFVAVDLLKGNSSREELWAVNTEKEYHETKQGAQA